MNASDITNTRQCNIIHIKSCHGTNTNLSNTNLSNTNLHNTNLSNTNKLYVLNNDNTHKFNQDINSPPIIKSNNISDYFTLYRNVNLDNKNKYILTVNLFI